MPRVAKVKVRMCRPCNGDFIEQFKAAFEGKENITFEEKCVGGGKCGTKTPFAKFEQSTNKLILEAASVEDLIAQVNQQIKT
jgi:hypothetical protein